MGVGPQQKLTWLDDLKARVRVMGQQVLRGMVHLSAHAGCYKQTRGAKGSVGPDVGCEGRPSPANATVCAGGRGYFRSQLDGLACQTRGSSLLSIRAAQPELHGPVPGLVNDIDCGPVASHSDAQRPDAGQQAAADLEGPQEGRRGGGRREELYAV
jgi:hypothetical protein